MNFLPHMDKVGLGEGASEQKSIKQENIAIILPMASYVS